MAEWLERWQRWVRRWDDRPPEPAWQRAPERPSPLPGARSWILLVLDSCRYDSLVAADTPHLDRLGVVQRRWAYASWTAPAHLAMLQGLLPHPGARGSWAADTYRDELGELTHRLGVALPLHELAPALWLPELLNRHGWRTGAWVSLPVLHPATPLARGFDTYRLRGRHDDLRGILDDLRFVDERPAFWLINAGETHYPYTFPGSNHGPLPRLSGLRGATRTAMSAPPPPFDDAQLADLHHRQRAAVGYVDGLLPRLAALAPRGTWLTVTADHGECFGEDGWFGHGPVVHDKVLEVPLVEGPLDRLRANAR